MDDSGIDFVKTLGVNGTVLGVTTLSDLEIILKLVLLAATIVWTGIKIAEALDKGNKESSDAKIHRPKDRKKEASELHKKRNGSGKTTGKSGSKGN